MTELSQSSLEQVLGTVWSEVFRREQVGVEENFFELGGNSLLGMDLTELIRARLGIGVSVVMLYQYPSIREMAQAMAKGSDADGLSFD